MLLSGGYWMCYLVFIVGAMWVVRGMVCLPYLLPQPPPPVSGGYE